MKGYESCDKVLSFWNRHSFVGTTACAAVDLAVQFVETADIKY